MSSRVRVGEFYFDLATGELESLDPAREATRLAPQPAAFLALLIGKRGDLLSRSEVLAELWPDVQVDVDQALSFCVRQVRAALGDSAAEPSYIETLPRRGYRLLVPVGEQAAAERRIQRASKVWPKFWIAAAVLVAAAGLAWFRAPEPAAVEPALRLGIMPFAAPREVGIEADCTFIAERLLADLGVGLEGRVGVVGPRTTSAYDRPGQHLRQLARDLELDYIVNGRFFATPQGPELLAELIRTEDGMHVWVQPFKQFSDLEAIASTISAEVRSRLEPG